MVIRRPARRGNGRHNLIRRHDVFAKIMYGTSAINQLLENTFAYFVQTMPPIELISSTLKGPTLDKQDNYILTAGGASQPTRVAYIF